MLGACVPGGESRGAGISDGAVRLIYAGLRRTGVFVGNGPLV